MGVVSDMLMIVAANSGRMRIAPKFLRRSEQPREMPASRGRRRLHLSKKRIGGPMGWLILARDKRQFQGMRDENDKAAHQRIQASRLLAA